MKKIFALSISLLISFNLFAHAIWIETNATGNKGEPHLVKVFFGEYAEKEKDSVARWFSDIEELSLWLTTPAGQKIQLNKVAAVDHYEASFVPSEDGVYTISITHGVKDLYKSSRIQYYAASTVTVNKNNVGSDNAVKATALSIKALNAPKISDSLSLNTLFKDKALTKADVTVVTPSGDSKRLETDENGSVSLSNLSTGVYFVEVFYVDKTPGLHNENEYKQTWHCLTRLFEVP